MQEHNNSDASNSKTIRFMNYFISNWFKAVCVVSFAEW